MTTNRKASPVKGTPGPVSLTQVPTEPPLGQPGTGASTFVLVFSCTGTGTVEWAIPVMDRYDCAFPERDGKTARKIDYAPLSSVLSDDVAYDAHFAAYHVPSVPHRLNKDFIGGVPVPMVLAVFDVDGPGHVATPEWREAEGPKLCRFYDAHPGVFFYETKGGHRLVAVIEPFLIDTQDAADAWRFRYLTWIAYLARCFGIVADDACSDWGHLYRMPHATRDDQPERRGTVGDPHEVGTWSPVITKEDRAAATDLLKGTKDLDKWREYADDQLARYCKRISTLPANTSRHPVVNKAAFQVGRLCPHLLDPAVALAALHAAVEAMVSAQKKKKVSPRDFTDEVERGFADGMREPFNPCDAARPSIVLGNDLKPVVDLAIRQLAATADDIYSRDGALVRAVPLAANEQQAEDLAGTPVICGVGHAHLRERISSVIDLQVFDLRSGTNRPTVPTDAVVSAVAGRKAFPGVRPLIGISETPLLRPDGTIFERAGYDGATGYVYVPGAVFPPVPSNPSQADANRALTELKEVWIDFPYRSEADRMVPIALLLSLLGRAAIEGNVPAFLGDGNIRGAGKTLAWDAAGMIAAGREIPKQPFPGDDEELRKLITTHGVTGTRVIFFDNITRPIGGATLDLAVTCNGVYSDRILGKTQLAGVVWRAVFVGTGKNLSTFGSFTRRVLQCRLESPLEQPETRTDFMHPALLPWALENRPRLVAAGLTILRAWFVAGRPGGVTWGSFEAWSQIIPPAIVWAGGADVNACRVADDEADDPQARALAAILHCWPMLGEFGVTAAEAHAVLYPGGRLPDVRSFTWGDIAAAQPPEYTELRDAIRDVLSTRPGTIPDAVALGKLLGGFKGTVQGGKKLAATGGRGGRPKTWRVVAV